MSLMPVRGERRSTFYDPVSRDAWDDDPFTKHQQVHQKQRYEESGVIAPSLLHGGASSHYTVLPSSFANAAIEWKDTPNEHIFKTVLPPGMRREDVRVEVEDDKILKISAECFTEKEERHDHYYSHHVERSSGKFLTSIRLPEDSRVDQIRSTMENGVLTVRVPRWEARHHHRHVIPVEII